MSTANYRVLAVSSRSAHDASIFPVAAKRRKRKIEPDLDLINQVEQVATCALKDRPGVLPGFRSMESPGGSDPRIANLSMISFANISLQKTAKTARSGRRRPVLRKGSPACCRRPRGGSTADPFLCKFGETDRRNLACCPDFKVSHSLLGDFVVAPAPDALPSLIIRRGDAPARRCGGVFE